MSETPPETPPDTSSDTSSETASETSTETPAEPVPVVPAALAVPVVLDERQLAQLAAAVTAGLAEYLAPPPVLVTPADVSLVVAGPGPEPTDPPEDGDPPVQAPVPGPEPGPPAEEI
ncbi:hypothetical protein AB0O01_13035 [Streptomyces sp. NPDC093252]|uniref:hypothetical protein n=1 Tax=Streptomyces sp. NPDC093252 TaxID=3154980 RepID=UPI00342228E8